MGALSSIGFASPAVLFGLVLLPVIWWLLRLTPPKPETEVFPPLRILLSLMKREETPAKSPWWLTLLRLLLAALVILALARPLYNPQDRLALGDGPLLLLVDNSWAATDWEARQRTADMLLRQAADRSLPVAIAATVAPANADVSVMDAQAAQVAFAAISPMAASGNRDSAIAKLIEAAQDAEGATLAFLGDGLATATDETAFAQFEGTGIARLIQMDGDVTSLRAITAANNRADAFEATVVRPENQTAEEPVDLAAYDERGRLLSQTTAIFDEGMDSTVARFDVPIELRNDMAVLRVSGQANAGAVHLLDENSRRRRFALLSGLAGDEAQPLLSPLYYIERAIAPWADIIRPRTGDLTTDIPAILDQGPAVIVMADIGVLPETVRPAVEEWIDNGGTLVRFAGPRMAGTVDEDTLLPVTLRAGERALGGALTWTEPQTVAPFQPSSPFSAIAAPQDVTVTRQILAEPDTSLAQKTWASLADGTPLVTGDRRGKGSIVLFHVTAEATWSNLPITGTFVDMLRQIAELSTNTGSAVQTVAAEGVALAPLRMLRADGELVAPAPDMRPLELSGETGRPTYENPAGLYGTPDAFVARNILGAEDALQPFTMPQLTLTVDRMAYATARQTDLGGWLFAIALGLLALDTLAMLWINGKFKANPARRPAVAALLAFAFVAPLLAPQPAKAQEVFNDSKPGDELILQELETTSIGYVLTGNAGLDEMTKAGISGISRFLASRTAFEPGDPVGLDIATDELSFFPLIYFPVDASSPMPSAEALARLDAYMQAGGTVLFDTRDQLGAELSGSGTPENQRLRDMLRDLNVPPLEPVPADHVLTKSFFILDNFPGIYASSPLWIEASDTAEERTDRPVRTGDGVSPIMITGNDLASAWALDASGNPLVPVSSGDPLQRIYAFRAGVNIMMYMLTGNYKADQVHIPALLERLGQ